MTAFMIHFLISNLFIAAFIGFILMGKRLFCRFLSSRLQYHLWFILLILLAIPFLKIPSNGLFSFISRLQVWPLSPNEQTEAALAAANDVFQPDSANWMNDVTSSINQNTPSKLVSILFCIWLLGMIFMLLRLTKSALYLYRIKQSSLPLQNKDVQILYAHCRQEMKIIRKIPIYSTAFLKSPIIAGFFMPRIYLPIHLVRNHDKNELRYMLLHELQHYKHKDALINYFMNLALIVYWFNFFVWYALKEMQNDREMACDSSVLQLLTKKDYKQYGLTLLHFAEKISLSPFPFYSGLQGNMAQMKKRMKNIASYRPASFQKKFCGILSFLLIVSFLFGFAPLLSLQAREEHPFVFDKNSKNVTYLDLDTNFANYNGSFVLYDESADSWLIYQEENAAARICPASTYKIYSALFGLESGVISPKQSDISWNGQNYFYEVWNDDQNLQSAMSNSVTWYFQKLDQMTGLSSIQNYIHTISYGNQKVGKELSSYWINGTLTISPIEQVELLIKFYYNEFGFSEENIAAVKDTIHLFSTSNGSFYGKTGTSELNGENVSGWFIGFFETNGHYYFFSTNIQEEQDADGPTATKLTLSILSDLNLWTEGL